MNISSAAPQTSAITSRPSSASEQSPRLNESDLKLLTQLKARDREVRAHEAAHQAAGGQHAGAMALTYEQGPDGVQYAVGGEVPISVSAVSGDPKATVEKMRSVRAAAVATAQLLSTDPAVKEPWGACPARDTYLRVSACGDDNRPRATAFLNASV